VLLVPWCRCVGNLSQREPGGRVKGRGHWWWHSRLFGDEQSAILSEQVQMAGTVIRERRRAGHHLEWAKQQRRRFVLRMVRKEPGVVTLTRDRSGQAMQINSDDIVKPSEALGV